MEPDLFGSHGYDFVTNKGSIIDRMEQYYDIAMGLFRDCGKNPSNLSVAFGQAVRFICHYTTDAHTIGQISSEFWGKGGDDKFDLFSEFVCNKKALPVTMTTYPDKAFIRTAVLTSMREVYDTYRGPAKKWWFVLSGDHRAMSRNAVKKGAEFAAAWVKLAWDSV